MVKKTKIGQLPQSEVKFLDEIFRGSTEIRSTLLTVLNERRSLSVRKSIEAAKEVLRNQQMGEEEQ